jgi:hypothetical protein
MKLALLTILLLLFTTASVDASVIEVDSVGNIKSSSGADSISFNKSPYRFRIRQLFIPTILVGFGVIGTGSDWMEYQNKEIRDELQEDVHKRNIIDDLSQYAPALSVYALNFCGVKGKHNFRDRTIILGTAYTLMMVTVSSMKSLIKVRRPDGSANNSFPSGHTATAFMGAEYLWQEYHEVSPWIGIAGYTVASGVGFFRIYNNRHWLTDVMAGAGIGILSAKAAYWLYPFINKKIFGKDVHATIVPIVSLQQKGLCCSITF